MKGKIIIAIEGDTARVEMWREDEGAVTCARFTAPAADVLNNIKMPLPVREH